MPKCKKKFRNALHTCGGSTVAQINRALSAELEKRAPQSDLVKLNLAPEAGDFRFSQLSKGRFKFKPKAYREALAGPVEYVFFTTISLIQNMALQLRKYMKNTAISVELLAK